MEKKLKNEKKKNENVKKKAKKNNTTQLEQEEEQEAQRKLDTEVLHQKDEAERRGLVREMLSDAESQRSSLNTSTFNLLANYQGN